MDFTVPGDVVEFESFRRWALSPDFPQRGRIDFLEGALEIDMTAEQLQSHGALKMEVARWLSQRAKERQLGQVFVDCARLNCPAAGLSCEPDVVFVAWQSLKNGTTRYGEGPDSFLEIVGPADLVVEVVSDSSVSKDTKRLPPLYAKAGIPEVWLADGRRKQLQFQVWHLKNRSYAKASTDANGYQRSAVLGCNVRLVREPGPLPNTWCYTLEDR